MHKRLAHLQECRRDRFQGRMAGNQLADAPRVSAPRRRPDLQAEAAQDAPEDHLYREAYLE